MPGQTSHRGGLAIKNAKDDASVLAQPITLPCGATLPNRLMKAAMTEGLAGADGRANQRHARLYRAWARGGIGLSLTGNVMVNRNYLERPGNVVIDRNDGEEALRNWAAAGSEGGTQLWMQISHPGRQCSRSITGEPVAPSSVPLHLAGWFARPRAMSREEIVEAADAYVRVAVVAQQTGFGGVQIHAAHGYLISQFLSPLSNRRDDEWGGGLENRARFLLRIVRETRAAVGSDFPVAVKLNSADFQRGGFEPEDSRQVARWLQEANVDLIEISGGTYENPRLLGLERESTRQREAYFLEYARTIRESVSIPLAVTGGFRSASVMAEAIRSGATDVIGMARPLCVETDLPGRLLAGTCAHAPCFENLAKLSEGRWAGPPSPIGIFRVLNAQVAVGWFYRQILLLADGKPPDRELPALRSLAQHLRDEIRLALARKRYLKAIAEG